MKRADLNWDSTYVAVRCKKMENKTKGGVIVGSLNDAEKYRVSLA